MLEVAVIKKRTDSVDELCWKGIHSGSMLGDRKNGLKTCEGRATERIHPP